MSMGVFEYSNFSDHTPRRRSVLNLHAMDLFTQALQLMT